MDPLGVLALTAERARAATLSRSTAIHAPSADQAGVPVARVSSRSGRPERSRPTTRSPVLMSRGSRARAT